MMVWNATFCLRLLWPFRSRIVCSQYRCCQMPISLRWIMTCDRGSPMCTDFEKPFLIAPTAREIVDVERRAGADLPKRIPQYVDLCHQQIRPAVRQVRSEEECPTRKPDCDDNPA
jgi:hypothetical protein